MSKELYQISLSSDILQQSFINLANTCYFCESVTDDKKVFINLNKKLFKFHFEDIVRSYIKISKNNGKKYLILTPCLPTHHFTKSKQPNLFNGVTTKYVIKEDNVVFDQLKLESYFIKILNKLEDFEDVFVIKDLSLSEHDLYKILTSNEIIGSSYKNIDPEVFEYYHNFNSVECTVNGNFNIPTYLKEKVENNLKKFGII